MKADTGWAASPCTSSPGAASPSKADLDVITISSEACRRKAESPAAGLRAARNPSLLEQVIAGVQPSTLVGLVSPGVKPYVSALHTLWVRLPQPVPPTGPVPTENTRLILLL